MQKTIVTLEERKIVGLKVRTSYKNEMDQKTSKIGQLVGTYFGSKVAEQIPNRTHPGSSVAVYTEYESDHQGPYTCFRYFYRHRISLPRDLLN